jgi:hypothetical protein
LTYFHPRNHLKFKMFSASKKTKLFILIFSRMEVPKSLHVRVKMRLNIKVIVYFVKSFIIIKICFSC